MGVKLAFYFNHYNTLGHSTRVFALVKAIKDYFKNDIEIVVLQGGKKQDVLPFEDYAKMYVLPYSFDKKCLFIEQSAALYKKIVASGKMERMLAKRMNFMKHVLTDFKPGLFITEYFPFGQEFWTFELPYLIEYLKRKFNPKIIASSGYINYSQGTYKNISKYYDYLFIHSPRQFSRNYARYLPHKAVDELDRVFADFFSKIEFTGFVFQDGARLRPLAIKAEYLRKGYKGMILVSRGGGIVNKRIILASLLVARRMPGLFFVVSCGPATGEKEFREYRLLAEGAANVKLTKVISPGKFNEYIEAADLSVNMAGYNTITRLLYYGKKTIIVPFHTSEQRWRAELAEKYLTAEVIPENELKTAVLEGALNRVLKRPQSSWRGRSAWFDGAFNTAKRLSRMI